MAITFVRADSANAANGADATALFGGAIAANDFAIAIGVTTGTSNRDVTTPTAGWTEVPGSDLYADDVQDTNMAAFYKVLTGAEGGVGVDGTALGDDSAAITVMVFRGVDTANPFDVVATTTTGTNSAQPDPTSITWSTAGTWVIIGGGVGAAVATNTYTFPTGYTTNATQAAGSDVRDCYSLIGYNSAPGNPENPGTITSSGGACADCSWAAVTIALKPAAGISGGTTDGFGIPIF